MKIKEELRTFTNDAYEKSIGMITTVDELNLQVVSPERAAVDLDRMARDLGGIVDCIKDLTYRLKIEQGAKP